MKPSAASKCARPAATLSAVRPIRVVGQPARVVATAMVGPICPVPMIATREMGSFVMVSSRNAGRNAPCRRNRCLTDCTADGRMPPRRVPGRKGGRNGSSRRSAAPSVKCASKHDKGIAMQDGRHTAILSAYPQAAQIVDIQSYRPGYLPYPARITLQTTAGIQTTCVLKVDAHTDIANHEAQVLRALTDLQLPVPDGARWANRDQL